ncbi:MAG: TIR domain-containing protein [Phycisphaerae bacterium]
MKVFISWSGARSKIVASALREWLPNVIQAAEPWMSDSDIEAGSRWFSEISGKLNELHVGIVCVVPENSRSAWLSFEAGALAKAIEESRVCPYLLDMQKADLAGPLSQFQAVCADRGGTFDLLSMINGRDEAPAIRDDVLQNSFDKHWPDLEHRLQAIGERLAGEPEPTERDQRDMIQETLGLVRQLARQPTVVGRPTTWLEALASSMAPQKEFPPNPELKAWIERISLKRAESENDPG